MFYMDEVERLAAYAWCKGFSIYTPDRRPPLFHPDGKIVGPVIFTHTRLDVWWTGRGWRVSGFVSAAGGFAAQYEKAKPQDFFDNLKSALDRAIERGGS